MAGSVAREHRRKAGCLAREGRGRGKERQRRERRRGKEKEKKKEEEEEGYQLCKLFKFEPCSSPGCTSPPRLSPPKE